VLGTGLRTLGQYGALPSSAVWEQFGRAGRLAQRCARAEDDRPVVPRTQERRLSAECEFEMPVVERERLLGALRQLVSLPLAELRGELQACGQVRLTVRSADGTAEERERARIMLALGQLLDGMCWRVGAQALEVTLERIQDAVAEQLTIFPAENEKERKLREVQRYLAARFGTHRLRRAVLAQPGARLPEWRVGWLD